jgi:hypothetical protein
MSQVDMITISLSPPYPDVGMCTAVVRLRGQDKYLFDTAAKHMGMPNSVLMRVLLVKGAERILRELGIEITYEQNDNIDLTKGEVLIDEKAGD